MTGIDGTTAHYVAVRFHINGHTADMPVIPPDQSADKAFSPFTSQPTLHFTTC